MTPSIRFVILFEGRTGSSLLGELLNENPKMSCLGEEVAELRHSGWDAQEEWMNKLYFDTDNFEDDRLNQWSEAVGFKVKLREIAAIEKFRRFIEENQILVIHMHRSNFIKQVVSSIRAIDLAKATGQYNLKKNQKDLIPEAYEIPLRRFNNTLLWLLDAVHKLDMFVAKLTVPIHYLTYEELCSDMDDALAHIDKFLGLPPHSAEPRSLKITDDNLRNVVINYDKIRRFYSDSVFARMFED